MRRARRVTTRAAILAAGTLLVAQGAAAAPRQSIVGGALANAADVVGAVAVSADPGGVCSGVQIGPRAVLTAAHCLAGATSVQVAHVDDYAAQGVDWTDAASWQVAAGAPAPDVAVVLLGATLPGRARDLVTTAAEPPLLANGTQLVVAGYGARSAGGSESHLRTATVPVSTSGGCAGQDARLVCTDSTGGAGPCVGDSGAPLLGGLDGPVVAIASFGDGTCDQFAAYERIVPLTPWIAGVAFTPPTADLVPAGRPGTTTARLRFTVGTGGANAAVTLVGRVGSGHVFTQVLGEARASIAPLVFTAAATSLTPWQVYHLSLRVRTPRGTATSLPVAFRTDDRRPPRVTPSAAVAHAHRNVALRFALTDDSGFASARVTVQQGRRVVATLRVPRASATGGVRTATWRAGAAGSATRFCIIATDGKGNRSRPACAAMAVV